VCIIALVVIPTAVLKRASARYGIVRLDDLREAGVGPKQVERLLSRGQLDRLHSGVYRIGGAPRSWEQRQLAACEATGGVASHRAAMRLWEPSPSSTAPEAWPVEVTVSRRRSHRPSGVTMYRSRHADLAGPPTRSGIPVTTPQRTLVDLASVLGRDQLTRVVEQWVVSRLLSVATLRHELDQLATRGRRGVRMLKEVLADWPVGDVQPDSLLELAFARLCRQGSLPQPVFQHELTVNGRARRIDFAYPELKFAIEVDGFWCRTDREVFQDHHDRQNELMEAGWYVRRFTWGDVQHRPEHVAGVIHSDLARRAA
jgi:very-short-patch-repair endonuclease